MGCWAYWRWGTGGTTIHHRAPDLGVPSQPANDKEKQAYEAAKSRVGQPLVKAWFSSARKPAADQVIETFRIGELVHRAGADTSAYAFSAQGIAQAYATTVKGGAGAVVLLQDGLYFVARLTAGDHRLQTLDPQFFKEGHGILDIALGGWIGVAKSVDTGWFAGRDWVYRVEPKAHIADADRRPPASCVLERQQRHHPHAAVDRGASVHPSPSRL